MPAAGMATTARASIRGIAATTLLTLVAGLMQLMLAGAAGFFGIARLMLFHALPPAVETLAVFLALQFCLVPALLLYLPALFGVACPLTIALA